jgi:hypothetical protein
MGPAFLCKWHCTEGSEENEGQSGRSNQEEQPRACAVFFSTFLKQTAFH